MTAYSKITPARRTTKKMDNALLKHLLKESTPPPAERATVPEMHRVQPLPALEVPQ